jgi:hypothetical protein
MVNKKAIILDPEIYEVAKNIVYEQYKKPSAFRSGALVKKYKELGGRYSDDIKKNKTSLNRWFNEKWEDVNPNKNNSSYPVYRPTIKINKNTPLVVDEIDKKNLISQSKLKQKIKGDKNLPPFKKK